MVFEFVLNLLITSTSQPYKIVKEEKNVKFKELGEWVEVSLVIDNVPMTDEEYCLRVSKITKKTRFLALLSESPLDARCEAFSILCEKIIPLSHNIKAKLPSLKRKFRIKNVLLALDDKVFKKDLRELKALKEMNFLRRAF